MHFRRRSSLLNRSQSSLSKGEEGDGEHQTQLAKSDVILTFQIEVSSCSISAQYGDYKKPPCEILLLIIDYTIRSHH